MGFTEEGQRDLMCIIVGVFNAAPGADNFSALAEPVLAGRSLRDLTADLVANPVFTQIYPAFATNTAFADEFLGNILGAKGDIVDDALWDAAQGVVVGALNGGASRADIIYDVIQYLKNDDADIYNSGFQGATDMLNNKVDVALYHSVENELTSEGKNFDDLSAIVNDVDDTQDSVDAAIAEVDEEVNQGDEFFLTTSQDEIVGTPVDDYIEGQHGSLDESSNPTTLQSGDTIDGGNGMDVLRVTVSTNFDDESDNQKPDITNVEEIQVANKSDDEYTLDLQFSSGFNTITLDQPLGDVELSNMNELVSTINLIGAEDTNTDLEISVKNAVANGDITVNLTNADNQLYIEQNDGDDLVENVTIHSMGGDENYLEFEDSSIVESYTIDGDTDLELYHETTGDADDALSVDAWGLMGGLYFYSEGDDSDTTVLGGTGDNDITTEDGDDTVTTQDGDDEIDTNDGDDVIVAGGGDDDVDAGDDDDTIDGGAGDDILDGGEGNDTILGGDGDDEIYIGSGDDTADGGAGNDTVYAYDEIDGDDNIDGGEGDADVLVIDDDDAEQATIDSDDDEVDEVGSYESQFTGFERIEISGDMDEDIDTADLDDVNHITLLDGFDGVGLTLEGLMSGGTLIINNDTVIVSDDLTVDLEDGAGDGDVLNLELSESESTADFGVIDIDGAETVNLNLVDTAEDPLDPDDNNETEVDLISTDLETLIITGNSTADLDGVALTSVETVDASANMFGIYLDLTANENDVTVTSGNDDSEVIGGLGSDTITLGDGDHYVEGGDDDGLVDEDFPDDDTITAGNASDEDSGSEVYGGDGDDTITLGDGEHYVEGGIGDDVIVVGGQLDEDNDDDTDGSEIYGDDGDDEITSGDGDDYLDGGDGDDTIDGGDGDDYIYGGTSDEGDTLTGGGGDDVFDFDAVDESQGVSIDTITDFGDGDDLLDFTDIVAVDYLGEANGYIAVQTALSGSVGEAVLDTSTSIVYIDVNGDADITDLDIAVELTGITDLSQSDFA